jgi:hypothetical protein
MYVAQITTMEMTSGFFMDTGLWGQNERVREIG